MRKIRESNQYICWNVSLMTLPLMLSEIIIFIKGFSSLFTFEILPSFMANYPMCSKIAWIICALCGLHELYGYVSSNDVQEKMTCHKIHICDLCGLHELCGCVILVYSDFMFTLFMLPESVLFTCFKFTKITTIFASLAVWIFSAHLSIYFWSQ